MFLHFLCKTVVIVIYLLYIADHEGPLLKSVQWIPIELTIQTWTWHHNQTSLIHFCFISYHFPSLTPNPCFLPPSFNSLCSQFPAHTKLSATQSLLTCCSLCLWISSLHSWQNYLLLHVLHAASPELAHQSVSASFLALAMISLCFLIYLMHSPLWK